MDNHTLWNLTRETWTALWPHFVPIIERLGQEKGLSGRDQGLLLATITFEPDTSAAARFRGRDPYSAAGRYSDWLPTIAEKGHLTEVSPGEYRMTDSGRAEVQNLIQTVRDAMTEADPLPPADSERLAGLLYRLVEASLNTPPPPDTWCIRLSHRMMPQISPPMPHIEQSISCLAAYRDDAHLAAWQPSGLSAPALEALTLLWRGEADSLAAVCEKLAHREHPSQVYAAALAELRERGFVDGPDDAPRVIEPGWAFRDGVENKTDHYFFAPWACLNDDEKSELSDLLTRLRDGLKK